MAAEKESKQFGSKTTRLQECQNLGLNVPVFFALPRSISQGLFENAVLREETAQNIIQNLPCPRYAVRSSALIEDAVHSSFAGQFETKLNVTPSNLSQAIYEVLTQASSYLEGNLEDFSLLIQEYIDPDYAGVIFTRSPFGQREMIVEYAAGSGEQVVGGKVKPKKVCFYTTENIPAELTALGIDEQKRKEFYNLEKIYGGPQDIEWCIKNNTFYFLQTRPITTVTETQYQHILFLENNLPTHKNFYFAKTEISEIAPRPDTATQDLLQKIYAAGGPIDTVYKKHKIQYTETNFLTYIGEELFVDKEKEIQSLLPSYTYFSSHDYSPKLKFDSQFFITVKNIFHLNTLKFPPIETQFGALKNIFENKTDTNIESFLHNYESIFETNLLCSIALKKLQFMIKKENISPLEILDSSNFFFADHSKYNIELGPVHWKGNSLEFNDMSDFVHVETSDQQTQPQVESWWNALPSWKKQQLKPLITNFILYNRFREYGRWAVVKQINTLRDLLPKSPQKKTAHNIPNEQSPHTLTQKYIFQKETLCGVSAGEATGKIVTREYLEQNTVDEAPKILYTQILSPDLTEYFPKIQGIISEQGGMLSHLSIVGRENHLPIVVNFQLSDDIKIGDQVHINGSTGKITKVLHA